MRIEMHDPQAVILREIAEGRPQRSVALTYAFIMRQEPDAEMAWGFLCNAGGEE